MVCKAWFDFHNAVITMCNLFKVLLFSPSIVKGLHDSHREILKYWKLNLFFLIFVVCSDSIKNTQSTCVGIWSRHSLKWTDLSFAQDDWLSCSFKARRSRSDIYKTVIKSEMLPYVLVLIWITGMWCLELQTHLLEMLHPVACSPAAVEEPLQHFLVLVPGLQRLCRSFMLVQLKGPDGLRGCEVVTVSVGLLQVLNALLSHQMSWK